MFVQSARFVAEHGVGRVSDSVTRQISVYGQERVAETVRLGKMNLAVHGLAGDIRQGNTYYEDLHNSPGRFDFVMANPPFNVREPDLTPGAYSPRPAGKPTRFNGKHAEHGARPERPLAEAGILRRYRFPCAQSAAC